MVAASAVPHRRRRVVAMARRRCSARGRAPWAALVDRGSNERMRELDERAACAVVHAQQTAFDRRVERHERIVEAGRARPRRATALVRQHSGCFDQRDDVGRTAVEVTANQVRVGLGTGADAARAASCRRPGLASPHAGYSGLPPVWPRAAHSVRRHRHAERQPSSEMCEGWRSECQTPPSRPGCKLAPAFGRVSSVVRASRTMSARLAGSRRVANSRARSDSASIRCASSTPRRRARNQGRG